MKTTKKPEVRIVLDTNALFSGSCSDLVNEKTRDFIKENSSFSDVTTSWYMPEVVISERAYQMRSRGLDLLPSVHKLERLLGHNLAITGDILALRVQEAIKRQMDELKLVCNAVFHGRHWCKDSREVQGSAGRDSSGSSVPREREVVHLHSSVRQQIGAAHSVEIAYQG